MTEREMLELARVKAEAFREAANVIEEYQGGAEQGAELLRAKADEIEKENPNDLRT